MKKKLLRICPKYLDLYASIYGILFIEEDQPNQLTNQSSIKKLICLN